MYGRTLQVAQDPPFEPIDLLLKGGYKLQSINKYALFLYRPRVERG